MKSIILTFCFIFSGFALAESPEEFEITGIHCGNPYTDERPNFQAAELNADNQASRRCYPYQFVKLRLGRFLLTRECRFPDLGAKVISKYTCAR